MKSDSFTLSTLKRAFDETAENVCAQASSYFPHGARVQLASLTINLDLEPRAENLFGFSDPESESTFQVQYSHDGKGQSDLQIGHQISE